MIKMIVFDLDTTISMPNKPVHELIKKYLAYLENTGIKIVLVTEKPISYAAGFSRQTGLFEPILIGENGAQIMFGADFPPEDILTVPVSEEEKSYLDILVESLTDKYQKDIWIQPNAVNMTLHLRNLELKQEIEEAIQDFLLKFPLPGYFLSKTREVLSLNHPSARRGEAVKLLMKGFSLEREEIMAVGEGPNDVSMFKEAGISIGVRRTDTTYNFSHISKVMDFIDRYITKELNEKQQEEEK